jgi:hypothetical protein
VRRVEDVLIPDRRGVCISIYNYGREYRSMSLTLGCRLFLTTTSSSIWIGEFGRAPPAPKVVSSGDR